MQVATPFREADLFYPENALCLELKRVNFHYFSYVLSGDVLVLYTDVPRTLYGSEIYEMLKVSLEKEF